MAAGGNKIPIEKQLANQELTERCLKYRMAGWSYPMIGEQENITPQWAGTLVRRALKAITKDTAKQAIVFESERLDTLFRKAMDKVDLDATPERINAALKIMDRRAKLLGLDKPVKQKAELTGANGKPLVPDGQKVVFYIPENGRDVPTEQRD